MQKFPMTAPGLQRLEDELRNLKSKERPDVIRAIAEARSHGDLSENAEYHAARDRQSFIEGRIQELEEIVSAAEVIDPSTSSKKPDVAGTGEAISELAGRHGNLISCRSRVEIKITQTSDGKLLLSDRQTGVSSDIAESVAGKASLENAAVKLVDRIVPVLVKAGAGN